MKNLGLAILPLTLTLVFAEGVQASCGSDSCPLDAHSGSDHPARFTLDATFQYIDQDRVRIGTHPATVGELPSAEDEIRTVNRLWTVQGSASISPRWRVAMSIPLVDRFHAHVHHEASGETTIQQFHYRGIGDLAVLPQWVALSAGHEHPTLLSLLFGIKIPTGQRHVPAVEGDEPEPPARPGTGSVDFLAGFHLMRIQSPGPLGFTDTRGSVFASGTYRLNGKGTEDYRVGREVQLSVGTSWAVTRRLRLQGQINSRFRGNDDIGSTDATRDNTGGSWVYLSPGLRVEAATGLSLSAYVQLPVYQNVNRIQIVSGSNLWMGASYTLPL